MTITLGWWIAPALVTLTLFGWAWLKCMNEDHHAGMFAPAASAIMALVLFPPAAVVSLIAWLIWALVT